MELYPIPVKPPSIIYN